MAIATLITRNCRLIHNFAELSASPIIASIIDFVHVCGVTRRCLGLLLLCSSLVFSVGLVSQICIASVVCLNIGSPVHLARISMPRDLISPPCFSFICVRKTDEMLPVSSPFLCSANLSAIDLHVSPVYDSTFPQSLHHTRYTTSLVLQLIFPLASHTAHWSHWSRWNG